MNKIIALLWLAFAFCHSTTLSANTGKKIRGSAKLAAAVIVWGCSIQACINDEFKKTAEKVCADLKETALLIAQPLKKFVREHPFIVLASGITIAALLAKSGMHDLTHSAHHTIDQKKLAEEIRSDLYKMFVHEMGIHNKNWTEITHKNTYLEHDLKNLYGSFNSLDTAKIQKNLDAFCHNWELEKIDIENLYEAVA